MEISVATGLPNETEIIMHIMQQKHIHCILYFMCEFRDLRFLFRKHNMKAIIVMDYFTKKHTFQNYRNTKRTFINFLCFPKSVILGFC